MDSLKFFISFLFKLNFSIPIKKKVLLYDNVSLNMLNGIIKEKKYNILKIRGETFNFFVILSLIFNKITITRNNYIKQYIKTVCPILVITSNEHDIFFYKLKNYFPNVKFIMVQNGNRSKNFDLLDNFKKNNKQKLLVDYYFLYNKHLASVYKKYLKFKPIISGSFLNNFSPINTNLRKKKNILFLSQYSDKEVFNNKVYYSCDKKSEFWVERQILPVLEFFCNKYKFNLHILFRGSNDNFIKEKKFYKSIIKNFIPIKNKRFKNKLYSYQILDKFNKVVFVDTTLGYEAMSRNIKTVSICCRKVKNKYLSNFTWPLKTRSKEGKFYLDKLNKKKMFKVLKSNFLEKNDKWYEKNKKIITSLISYDQGNKKLKKTIKDILN